MSLGAFTPDKARILLVDDDDAVRAAMRRALVQDGLVVVEAESGDAAAELIETAEPFDLLVTDMCMPGSKSGMSLATDWRKRAADRPVLLVSADFDAWPAASQLGPEVTMLRKPFRRACLTRTVQRLLQEVRAGA